MGSGLTRAAQAAARSRWDGKISSEMREFLEKLDAANDVMTRGQIGPVGPFGGKARRKCSILGLAEEAIRKSDEKVGWRITDAGRIALRGGWEAR